MKKILVLGFLFLCIPCAYVKASVVITELMYDPPGSDDKHEWVEVVNTGSSSIDLTKYFLQTDGSGSSYHAITSGGSTSFLAAGSYAVITQDVATFLTDHYGFSGSVFDSSWSSLSNSTGKTLVINDANKVGLDQYTYDPTIGSSNDGNSLQRNSSAVWIAGLPTPGAVNTDTPGSEESTQVNSDTTAIGTGASSGTTEASSVVPTNSPQALLSIPRIGTVGVAIDIAPSLVGVVNPSTSPKTFHVSLGDGSEHNDSAPLSFRHTYSYPGTYIVTFTYQQNPYDQSSAGDLSVRKIIEIVPGSVTIDMVHPDGSIQISNPTAREIDMSRWVIRSKVNPDALFVVPVGTIILPGKTIYIPKGVGGFSDKEEKSLILALPSGAVAATYDPSIVIVPKKVLVPAVIKPIAKVPAKTVKKTTAKKTAVASSVVTTNYADTLEKKDVESIAPNQLQAQAGKAADADHSSRDLLLMIVSGVGVAGTAVGSVFMLKSRQKDNVKTEVPEEESVKQEEVRIVEE